MVVKDSTEDVAADADSGSACSGAAPDAAAASQRLHVNHRPWLVRLDARPSRAQKLARSLELALTEVLYPPKVDQKLSIGGLRES